MENFFSTPDPSPFTPRLQQTEEEEEEEEGRQRLPPITAREGEKVVGRESEKK